MKKCSKTNLKLIGLLIAAPLALLLPAGEALAQSGSGRKETVISVQNFKVKVSLNEQTVLCSIFDYSARVLKVLVPELDKLTVLNHENTGAGSPCLGAGQCTATKNDRTFLSSGPSEENINLQVTRTRVNFLDAEKQTCMVSLKETIKTQIHGVPFFHEREVDVSPRKAAGCLN